MNALHEPRTNKEEPFLPLVRLGLILPFVEELDRLGIPADAVLMRNGLVRETVCDPNVFVPAIVVHRFLEDAARAAEQPYFGVVVGERLDLAGWPPLVDAVSRATTLGEFLIRFMRSAKDEATSAHYALEVEANHAFFREKRTSEQEIAPAQNDAFMATFTLGVLRRGAGSRWDPEQVQLTVCDPDALPKRYQGVTIIRGDRKGMFVRFPTEWLFQAIDQRALIPEVRDQKPRLHVPVAFRDALRQTVLLHIQDADLGVDLVAGYLGMGRQVLQRRLQASGTTMTAEIIDVKKQRAAELLVETDKSVVEIATAVGFTNSTSFARAFKSWSGESPREYRKKRRGHVDETRST